MKRCAECRRSYYDDTLSFCLDDGTPLLDGPATSESATAILSSGDSLDESPTAVLSKAHSTLGSSGSMSGAGASTASSAEYLVGEIRRRKTVFSVAALVLFLAAGGAGFAVYKYGWPDTLAAASAPFQSVKIERLTSNGKATQAVISPDGKQVVYVIDDAGKRSLWLRQVATASDVRLTEPTSEVFYWTLTISPDGNFLYYVYGGTTIRNRDLFRMPLLGAASPTKVIEDVGSSVGFSPDGKQIAFVRSRQQESSMMVANVDGTGEREISKRKGERSYGSILAGGVAWSADGKKIATVANNRDESGRFQHVIEISIDDGTERSLTSHKWYEIRRLAGLADGSGLVIIAAEKPSDLRACQIWFLPYAGGEARKITNDLNHYSSISPTADSSALVTVQEDMAMNIWIAPDGDARRAVQIPSVSGKMDGFDGIEWTPDGRIVYNSMTGVNEGIWIMDADGKNRKRLTSPDITAFYPSVSTDGRFIVFTSEGTERGRARRVMRMDIDGSNPKQLTERGGGGGPSATAEWVVYGGAGLWKVRIDGGEPVKISEEGLGRCAVSPDGKLVACQLDKPGEPTRLAVVPIEGGVPPKVFDVKLELPARIKWAPDGKSVTYVSRREGLRDIWSQPVDGGEEKKLTDFKADQIFTFDWSRDNKLVISHGTSTSDVVLIRNTK